MAKPLDEITVKIDLKTGLPLSNVNVSNDEIYLFASGAKFVYYNGRKYIRDRGSDNARMVNGIPIRQIKYRLFRDDFRDKKVKK